MTFRRSKHVAVSGVLTLPQAVAIATAHNREYQLQKELLYTTALDSGWSATGTRSQLFGGGTSLYSNDGTDETVTVEANVGFNRLLAIGALVSTSVGARWVDVLLGLPATAALSSVLGASGDAAAAARQRPKVVLEPLTQAERNTLYQIRTFNRFRKTFVVSVITQYYEVLELNEIGQERGGLPQLAGDAARTAWRSSSDAGRLPAEELDRVRQEVLRARDTLTSWRRRSTSDSSILSRSRWACRPPWSSIWTWASSKHLRAKGIPYPDFVVERGHRDGPVPASGPDQQRRHGARCAACRLCRAKDALGTGLDVCGQRRYRHQTAKETLRRAPVLDLPLDRVPEQDVYRKALVLLNQRQREYDQAADTVRLEVREAHRKLLETAERYEILSEGLRTGRRSASTRPSCCWSMPG